MSLQRIHNKYLKDCTLTEILNKFSIPDAILNSGGTSILVEYKNRSVSVLKYQTAILEKEKWHRMIAATTLINSPYFFYVCEYDELILFFLIDFKMNFDWDTMPLPFQNGSQLIIGKEVAHLKYQDAELIISKKDWQRKSVDDLNYYIKVMNEKNEREN